MSKKLDVFLGKSVDMALAKLNDFDYGDAETYEEPYLEKFLYMDVMFDEHGYNGYSVMLILDGNKISNINRIAHCHMKGGQGADDEIDEFPHKELEDLAYEEIKAILQKV